MASVPVTGAKVADRHGAGTGQRGDLGEQRVVDLSPEQRAEISTPMIVGATAVSATDSAATPPFASSDTDAAAPTTAISIARRYSRRTYALP